MANAFTLIGALTITTAVALAAAAAGPLRAAEPTYAERCVAVGDVTADTFDRMAEFLPACEADPRTGNAACTIVVTLAVMAHEAGLMTSVVDCSATGNSLGQHSDRLSGLLIDVGARLTALSDTITE